MAFKDGDSWQISAGLTILEKARAILVSKNLPKFEGGKLEASQIYRETSGKQRAWQIRMEPFKQILSIFCHIGPYRIIWSRMDVLETKETRNRLVELGSKILGTIKSFSSKDDKNLLRTFRLYQTKIMNFKSSSFLNYRLHSAAMIGHGLPI